MELYGKWAKASTNKGLWSSSNPMKPFRRTIKLDKNCQFVRVYAHGNMVLKFSKYIKLNKLKKGDRIRWASMEIHVKKGKIVKISVM